MNLGELKNDIAYMKNNKRLMRVNKLLANKKMLLLACLFFSFILFTAVNYLIVSVPKLIGHLSGEEQTFSLLNAFDYSKIIDYYIVYLLVLILIVALNLRIIYLMRISYKDNNIGQKGTARFTLLEEVKAQYKEIDEKDTLIKESGGIPVCMHENNIYIDDSPVNNLIIGITRSGKGEMLVFPMIDIYSRAENKASLIITDPKLELYSSSRDTLIKRGYDVKLINLVEPLKSSGFNPLNLIVEAYKNEDYMAAEMLCNSFTATIFTSSDSGGESSPFFTEASKGLTSALILALIDEKKKEDRLEDVNMYSVVQILIELTSHKDPKDPEKTMLDVYFNNRPAGDKAKSKYAVVQTGSDRTKGNVYSTTLSKLTIFTYEEIAKMTAVNNIDMKAVGFSDKPTAIFIGIPDYDSSNHYIASIFIRQLYFVLAKSANLSEKAKCEREVIFILDEFGNLPPIEGMENIITVCLGRNIKFNLVIQSYAQIKKLYGESSDTIIGNCGNQIYIQSADKETAMHFSELIGSETITNVNRSGERMKLNKTITEMYEERPLLNKTELQELKTGECVVKRIMKRKDLKGNDIVPHAIFNTGSTRFKFRYEYLLDSFPNRSIAELDLDEANKYINLNKGLLFSDNSKCTFVSELKNSKEIEELLIKHKLVKSVKDLTIKECETLVSVAFLELKIITKDERATIINLLEN